MATLTREWETYASKTWTSGSNSVTFQLQARYVSQSVSSNSSVFQTRLRSVRNSSSFGGYPYKFTCSYASTVSGSSTWTVQTEVITTSPNKTANHNEDGTRTVSIGATASITGLGMNVSLSTSVSLPKILRYPVLTSGQNFNDESEDESEDVSVTLNFTNPSKSYPIRCKIEAGGDAQLITRDFAKTVTSGTITLTEAEKNTLRALTPNSKTLTVRETVCAMNGNTELSASYKNYTMSIINAEPEITMSLKEKNTNVINLLGTDNARTIILNASRLEVSTTPTAYKSATISKVKVLGIVNGEVSNSPYTIEADVTDTTSDSVECQAIDSRGFVGSVKTSSNYFTFLEYNKVKQNSFSFKRINPTSPDVRLLVNSVYYQQTFGTTPNVPTVKYKIGETGSWITIPSTEYEIDNVNHTLEIDYTITNAIPYNAQPKVFYLEVSDLLSSWNNQNTITKGIPVFEFGDDEVQVNGDLYIADTNRENRINVKDIVSGGGTLLYYNSNGSNGNISLSDSASNYDYIEIFYRTNDMDYSSVKVYEPDGKNVILNGQRANSATPRIYGKTRTIYIDDTSVTTVANSTTQYTVNNGSASAINNSNYIYIIRIVGYTNETIPNEIDIYDTGWQEIVATKGTWGTLRYRVVGKEVFVEGSASSYAWSGSSGDTIKDTAIPPEYCPTNYSKHWIIRAGGVRIALLYLTTAGKLGIDYIVNVSNGSNYTSAVALDFQVSYLID